MIAVDTSALMAIVLGEPQADACVAAPEAESGLLIPPARSPRRLSSGRTVALPRSYQA